MERLSIEGSKRICGEIAVHGAKNSTLPILAASLLADSHCYIENCPDLIDVNSAVKIIRHLGCEAERSNGGICINPNGLVRHEIPDHLMREMRSSVIFLGAILSKVGEAYVSFPGGCELGPRPIGLHLDALRKMGVEIIEHHGFLNCKVKRLKGAEITLAFPSVGATENIILAAATAEGTTIINNPAKEPEIEDLQNFLNSMGADIHGAGSSTIVINGVKSLHGTTYNVIPDRIVAATYIAAAAITSGELLLTNVIPGHLDTILSLLSESGCKIKIGKDFIYIKRDGPLLPAGTVRTMPYPGFPTDAQSLMVALYTQATGPSVFVENIFQNRYNYVGELLRMGASIRVEGRVAVVEGNDRLMGAQIEATDLRGGAAMVIAALAAQGRTEIYKIHHIDRGYEKIEQNLSSLGADIKRLVD